MGYNEAGRKSRSTKSKRVVKYKASKGADFDDDSVKSIKNKAKYNKEGEITKIKRVKKTKGGGTMVTVSKQGLETNPMAPKGAKGLVTTRTRTNKKFGASSDFPEIKKENEGKFTKWVEKNMPGMDTCKAASKIMRSRTKKYSPAVIKMANYANNFGCKTKKEDGASIGYFGHGKESDGMKEFKAKQNAKKAKLKSNKSAKK